MKHFLEARPAAQFTLAFALATASLQPLPSLAASVSLATEPLTTSTASNVKPNLMFILDDSGSMSWDYLPDWAAADHPVTFVAYTSMLELFKNAGFNGLAYNPATTYTPPVLYNADGTLDTTTYPNIGSPWTSVKYDGYGIQSYDNVPTTPNQKCPGGGYPTGGAPNGACNLVGSASHYVFIPGEYCSSERMTSCVPATSPTTDSGVLYDKPAGLRWCNSSALTTCQSIRNSTYRFPRYPKPATATVNVTNSTAANTVTQISVNSQNIMNAAAVGSTTESTTATNIRNAINACTAAIAGNCTVAGYSATVSGTTVKIYAPNGTGNITYLPVVSGGATTTKTAFTGGVPGFNVFTNIVSTNDSYAYPGTTSKAPTRTDCVTDTTEPKTCTYIEEMTNYANWWTYYHTRMQSMKTAVSRSFKSIDNRFRVGFSTISETTATNGTKFLGNDTFQLAHKRSWFTKLFAQNPTTSTPLRGALAKAGRYYADLIPGQVDPVQYSCQQNFTILSTDGYWNTWAESPSSPTGDGCTNNTSAASNYGPRKLDNKTCIGNQDPIASTSRPMKEGTTAVSNTLADIAKYYYETDLRESGLSNCTGGTSPDGTLDVCDDNVFSSATDNEPSQHMTTFTMGLGADGTLVYSPDYTSIQQDNPAASPPIYYPAPSSGFNYYQLLNGYDSVNWPDPISKSEGERIDDLWHAAVNGRGIYFSAKNPDQIVTGFNKALSSITAKLGSAAAAATSTLNPVSGNNYVYLASYTTVNWTGNLEARTIDINTAIVSETPRWCAENILQDSCTSPSQKTGPFTVGASVIWNCVTPNVTLSECPSPGDYNDLVTPPTCTTQIDNGCTGKLPPRITGVSTDNRTIYTAPAGALTPLSGQNLVPFDTDYATANPTSFSAANVSGLTQWGTISSAHTGTKLINYLRGQSQYEMRASNVVADQLYRSRNTVMGDTLESQPAFIANPVFNYTYPGYSTYKANQVNRKGTVFVGSNDGMLHAFVAADYPEGAPVSPEIGGRERWAYVPSMVIPKMWKLADSSYATKHTNFINGSPIISDVCVLNCSDDATAVWKTILVGGLNGGGRGYYALDVTVPETPVLMWEFTTNEDNDLGYSYGRPSIVRRADGTWVVVVTSGYNNISPGSGEGILFVLKASDGTILSKISTGVGDTATPSGLAQVAVWNDASGGNQAGYAYATDLLGNIWRFNINNTTGTDGDSTDIGPGGKLLFATLYSDLAGTLPQPITTPPVLGLVSGQHVIFVGTGKYLEASDLTNTQQQTLYAIKDVGSTATTLDNPRSKTIVSPKMIEQTIVQSGSIRTETVAGGGQNPVDFNTDMGWFIDFPDASTGSERVNIAPKLVLGTLLVPTIVPSSTVCSPGGYGWFNYFDYSNGFAVAGGTGNSNVSIKSDSPYVGFNIIYISGEARLLGVTANGDISEVGGGENCTGASCTKVPFGSGSNQPKFQGTRAIWHELIPQ